MLEETLNDLCEDLKLGEDRDFFGSGILLKGQGKYIRDLRINLKNALNTENLSPRESYLLAFSVANNQSNPTLARSFERLALGEGASPEEVAESLSCGSLLAGNNVLYRFRHLVGKDVYNGLPARIKMTLMMNPVMGKELFELISLAVSAVNGCESCIRSHEASLVEMGCKEERIFDAVRIATVVVSATKVLNHP